MKATIAEIKDFLDSDWNEVLGEPGCFVVDDCSWLDDDFLGNLSMNTSILLNDSGVIYDDNDQYSGVSYKPIAVFKKWKAKRDKVFRIVTVPKEKEEVFNVFCKENGITIK